MTTPNNQPWAFAVIRKPETKDVPAGLTHYSGTIKAAPVRIAAFLDNAKTYDRTKEMELMAVVALGYSAKGHPGKGKRRAAKESVFLCE